MIIKGNEFLEIGINDLIYIPFAGSGSDIIACIESDRNYLATEISKQYIDEIIIPRIKSLK